MGNIYKNLMLLILSSLTTMNVNTARADLRLGLNQSAIEVASESLSNHSRGHLTSFLSEGAKLSLSAIINPKLSLNISGEATLTHFAPPAGKYLNSSNPIIKIQYGNRK